METHAYSQTDTQFQEPLRSPREVWEGRGHGHVPGGCLGRTRAWPCREGRQGGLLNPGVLIEKIRPSQERPSPRTVRLTWWPHRVTGTCPFLKVNPHVTRYNTLACRDGGELEVC